MESVTFGSRTTHMEQLGAQVERALGIGLEPHESSYLAGDYLTATTDLDEEISVLNNTVEEDDGEVLFPEFHGYVAIVTIEDTERAEEFAAALAGIRHLELLRRVPDRPAPPGPPGAPGGP